MVQQQNKMSIKVGAIFAIIAALALVGITSGLTNSAISKNKAVASGNESR